MNDAESNLHSDGGLLAEFERAGAEEIGEQLHRFAAEIYPICRSITGDGMRKTLKRIGCEIPLQMTEVPSGAQVFDWTVPKEWNIRDAYIRNARGERVVDWRNSNLHVLNYSVPVRETLPLNELKKHLFSIPERPEWTPYRTSYYKEAWGFCLPHQQLVALEEGDYEVCIDSTLADGHLTYGECLLRGESTEEVLISIHACHPSLANDNLSGLSVATRLAQLLIGQKLKYSYRFLFIPGTIGAITWLARNQEDAARIRHGLVLTCIGDAAGFHYKKSRRGDATIDRVMAHVLQHCEEASEILDFSPYGYDERQYCSPGFNLPVGCLMRSVWGTFPEYHTSADNLEFIRPLSLARSLRVCLAAIDVIENDRTYRNLNPWCEPQLGKRDLYRSLGDGSMHAQLNARLWVLNLSDGIHSLLKIAERSGLSFQMVRDASEVLRQGGLLEEVTAART